MTTEATNLLLDIASEKNGYQIGEPWRFTEFSLAAIVPILREARTERAYKLLAEAGDEVTVIDTGSIDKVEVRNLGSVPVLVKAGELVAGSTQTRAIAMSQVVMPMKEWTVKCYCTYQTKMINPGEQVKSRGYSPPEVLQPIYSALSSGIGRRGPSGGREAQHDVWGSITNYSQYMSQTHVTYSAAGSSGRLGADYMASQGEASGQSSWSTHYDDLAGRITESAEKFKEALEHIPRFDNQVGMALLSINDLDSLESFEHPGSWEAMRDNILKAEAGKIADVSDQDSVFAFKTEKAKAAVRELLTSQFEESVGVAKEATMTVILKASKFTGEVVTLYGEPIHCSFVKNSGKE
ncbi:MAG: ARPP-1 family domain-containing protein [Dehalococcoidia bacterium]